MQRPAYVTIADLAVLEAWPSPTHPRSSSSSPGSEIFLPRIPTLPPSLSRLYLSAPVPVNSINTRLFSNATNLSPLSSAGPRRAGEVPRWRTRRACDQCAFRLYAAIGTGRRSRSDTAFSCWTCRCRCLCRRLCRCRCCWWCWWWNFIGDGVLGS